MTSPQSSDLKAMAETAERFAARDLAPRAIDLDNYPFAAFNQAALDAGRAAGLFGVNLPEDLGGSGLGMEALCETLFPLAREDASFAALILADSLARSLLVSLGRGDDAKLSDRLIGFALYDLPEEPQSGLSAKPDGDGFVLTGAVESVALAPVAGSLILPAVLDGVAVLFLVEAGAAGLTVSPPVISLGLRGCPVADATLTQVRVGAPGLLTRDAIGAVPVVAMAYRAAVAAIAAGIADGSFRAARAYAAERYQGGKMIIEYDMVRQMLAGIVVASETGQALYRELAREADLKNEKPGTATISAKPKMDGSPGFSDLPFFESGALLAAEQATAATTDGVQILGGYGYMEDYGQEKRMRDAKQTQGIFGPAPIRRLRMLAGVLTE